FGAMRPTRSDCGLLTHGKCSYWMSRKRILPKRVPGKIQDYFSMAAISIYSSRLIPSQLLIFAVRSPSF
ncbi:MAG: hypothetical protein ACK566_09070, partial [Bacteroidota bacterium]